MNLDLGMTQSDSLSAAGSPPSGRWALVIILIAGIATFLAGSLSEIVRGDEVYHTQFARAWAEAGLLNRPTHDPVYASGEPPGYGYTADPVWPMMLSVIWSLTGATAWVAQAYQACWFAILLAAVYLLGRRLFGPRGAIVSVLLAASTPMFVAFSVLLYVDVLGTALAAITVLLLLGTERARPKKDGDGRPPGVLLRCAAAGIVLGLAYLTKRNTLFLAPGLVLWLLWQEGTFWQRCGRAFLFLAAAALVITPNAYWVFHHIPPSGYRVTGDYLKTRLSTFFTNERLPSSLADPADVLRYFGVLVLATTALYVVRRAWTRRDAWLWIWVGLYYAAIALFFTLDTDVRYVMPAVPILILAVARGLSPWWDRKWFVALVALVAFGQLAATAWFVNHQRHLTPGQRAVFAWLRENTPEGTLVLYPGEILMAEARRPVVWASLIAPETGTRDVYAFLRRQDAEGILRTLRLNRVEYICVDGTQVSPRAADTRLGGYPQAFVDRLPGLPFLEEVPGNWPGMSLWRVCDEASMPGAGRPSDEPHQPTGGARPTPSRELTSGHGS